MSFLSFFKSQIPGILIQLKAIKIKIGIVQKDLERLLILEQNLSSKDLTESQYESFLKAAIDCFGVALWIKDESSRFIFVNKVCCESMLECKEDEALSLTDADFEKNNDLAKEYVKSDKKVMENMVTKRFIEYSINEDNIVFLDSIKSPRIEEGKVIGTIGSGVVITDSIPKSTIEKMIKRKMISGSIEIPVAFVMGTQKLVKLLEENSQKNGEVEEL